MLYAFIDQGLAQCKYAYSIPDGPPGGEKKGMTGTRRMNRRKRKDRRARKKEEEGREESRKNGGGGGTETKGRCQKFTPHMPQEFIHAVQILKNFLGQL